MERKENYNVMSLPRCCGKTNAMIGEQLKELYNTPIMKLYKQLLGFGFKKKILGNYFDKFRVENGYFSITASLNYMIKIKVSSMISTDEHSKVFDDKDSCVNNMLNYVKWCMKGANYE